MEPQAPLPWLQESATGLCHEPHEFISHRCSIIFFKTLFNIIFPLRLRKDLVTVVYHFFLRDA
jgi:hypothetical protein